VKTLFGLGPLGEEAHRVFDDSLRCAVLSAEYFFGDKSLEFRVQINIHELSPDGLLYLPPLIPHFEEVAAVIERRVYIATWERKAAHRARVEGKLAIDLGFSTRIVV